MTKKILFFTLSLILVFSLSAFAGEGSDTVGGGKLLPQLRYGYSITDWKTNSSFALFFKNWDLDAHRYYLQVNWGVFENLDLFVLVGGSSARMKSASSSGYTTKTDRMPMFVWGLGINGTFFRADNGLYIGGGALFTHSFGNNGTLTAYNPGGSVNNVWDFNYSVYSLTPELHVGWHIGDTGLTPYIGVDYTWARAMAEFSKPSGSRGEIEYSMDDPVYMFAGLDYYLNDRLYVNVEGRTNFNEGWGVETGVGYVFDICPKPAPEPEPEPAPVIEPKLEPMSKN